MYSYRTVLIDNNRKDLAYLRQVVTRLGHQVVGEASEPIKGITTIRSLQPDLVIVNLQLCDTSLFDLAQIVASDRIAALVIIGNDEDENLMQRMGDFWACELISAPLTDQSLNLAMEIACIRFAKATRLEKEVDDLKETLETKKVLDRAKALLIRKMGMSEDQAFKHIQQLAMKKRVTKKAISEALIMALDD